MSRYKSETGYSLIELLVVIAIVAITMAVAAFSYSKVTRASRVKQGLSDLYNAFSNARNQAIMQNGEIEVHYDTNTRAVTFVRNGTVLNRIVFSKGTTDPKGQPGDKDYHFEKLTVIQSETRDGSEITGVDVDGDGTDDTIDILTDDEISNLVIRQNGFIDGLKDDDGDVSAILLMHQGDIDDKDTSGERQYALIIFKNGSLKKARHISDASGTGSWELF